MARHCHEVCAERGLICGNCAA
ncbi:hypothetical protein [Aeromonas encheleia]